MSRRVLLALSAALTTSVLFIAGAASSHVLWTRSALLPSVAVPSTADAVPEDVVRAREAEYRRLVDEANTRLRDQKAEAAAAPAAPEAPRTAAEPEHAERGEARRHHDRDHDRARAHREDDDG